MKFLDEVDCIAKVYGVNYFIVTDGASRTSNSGNKAVKNARETHKLWEIENGINPNHDWSL